MNANDRLKAVLGDKFTAVAPEVLERWRRRTMAAFDLADIPIPCPPELEAERDRLLGVVNS